MSSIDARQALVMIARATTSAARASVEMPEAVGGEGEGDREGEGAGDRERRGREGEREGEGEVTTDDRRQHTPRR
jgi:hypothetical protein